MQNKKKIQINIFARQKQTQKANLWLPKGKLNRLGLAEHTTIYKIDKEKDLYCIAQELCSITSNNYNGKESENTHIYIYSK